MTRVWFLSHLSLSRGPEARYVSHGNSLADDPGLSLNSLSIKSCEMQIIKHLITTVGEPGMKGGGQSRRDTDWKKEGGRGAVNKGGQEGRGEGNRGCERETTERNRSLDSDACVLHQLPGWMQTGAEP